MESKYKLFFYPGYVMLGLFFFCMSNLSAQSIASESKVINGVVRDDSSTLAGVTVAAVDNAVQTVTDSKGAFSIRVPAAMRILKFSSVGYNTREVVIGSNRTLAITLVRGAQQLDAVVVVSYGR